MLRIAFHFKAGDARQNITFAPLVLPIAIHIDRAHVAAAATFPFSLMLGNFKKHIFPVISINEASICLRNGIVGAFISGAYGMLHDQITYGISNEYFTKFKFEQFSYADVNLGNRAYASIVGFLATWWVGFFVMWFLTRYAVANVSKEKINKLVYKYIGLMIIITAFFGIIGFVLGTIKENYGTYNDWLEVTSDIELFDIKKFVTVGYIHNAGYLGALIGLIVSTILMRREAKLPNQSLKGRM